MGYAIPVRDQPSRRRRHLLSDNLLPSEEMGKAIEERVADMRSVEFAARDTEAEQLATASDFVGLVIFRDMVGTTAGRICYTCREQEASPRIVGDFFEESARSLSKSRAYKHRGNEARRDTRRRICGSQVGSTSLRPVSDRRVGRFVEKYARYYCVPARCFVDDLRNGLVHRASVGRGSLSTTS